MNKTMSQQWLGAEEYGGSTQMSAMHGVASLTLFPSELQQVIKAAVLKAIPQRATDIWYQDKVTGNVFVMRHSLQWQLNETASFLWLLLNDGRSVETIVGELCKKYPDDDSQEIEFMTVEFLLHASSHGLIDFSPEPCIEKPKEETKKGHDS